MAIVYVWCCIHVCVIVCEVNGFYLSLSGGVMVGSACRG